MTKDNQPNKPSRLWYSIKVILGLMLLSFFFAVIVGVYTEDDIENLQGNVAIISISGPIVSQGSDSLFGDEMASADDLKRLIRKANEDNSIKAIIFEINSPGGSAVASDEIASEIKKINKTTVAWIREIGTSGAYWIASSTDHIVANRMSITGSIGVIASYLGFEGLMEEYNVSYNRLVSGKYKDMGSPFKELTDEEKRIFQEGIDSIHGYFVDEVAKNRNLPRKDVEKMATGAFYIGIKAKEMGLVDELGGEAEVLSYVEEQIGEEADIMRFHSRISFWDTLSGAMNENFYFMGKGLGSTLETESGLAIRT